MNSKEMGLVPRKRFPEFASANGWSQEKLGNAASLSKGKGISKADISIDGTLPCIRYGELYTEYGEIIKNIKSRTNIPSAQLVLSQFNDVLIPSSGETREDIATASCVLKDGVALGGDINIIRSGINGVFLSYCLNNTKKRAISKIAQGDAVVHLYNTQLEKLEIEIPSLEEQQKIAACLSSLDDLIAAETQKLEALKAHKKGLMQQLFPAEGETVPRLRFEGFEGEWEQKTLGEIAKFSSGGTPSKDNPEYWDGTIPWISAVSMHNYTLHDSELKITDLAVAEGAAIAKEGQLLILVRGSMLYKRIPMGIAKRELSFNQDVKAISLDASISSDFLLHFLVASEPVLLDKVTATGIGAGKLDLNDLKQFLILVPSHEEQSKIVDSLSAFDEQVSAQIKKVEILKTHKRALLQNLFPSVSE
ncbi:restriction endonuclease subunit S [Flaviaesturariibacter flavus]|uniref:Restriction endonuclease subunit S n=1 Tax=Flaviaesturariibacter flavus TaxID=2502780 RepID=A0A4R1BLB0_9BACT|nr:restriction endonuclease subunit S [Flaviaesturariibacter flavus]TCJ18139.1 restriction endonuclease subunit S [Flaviaesturariibacter flavus]